MKPKTPSLAVKRIIRAPRVAPQPQSQTKMHPAPVAKRALPAKSAIKAASAITGRPISTAISTVFQNDDDLRSAITDQLKKRVLTADVSSRAKKVFAKFKPSSHPPSVHAAPNFLAPGGHLTHAQQGAMNRSLDALRNSSTNRTMTLRQTDALASFMQTKKKSRSGAAIGTISLPNLLSYLNTKVPAARLIARPSPITTCEAQIKAEAAMKSITNPKASTASIAAAGTNPAADPSQNENTGNIAPSDFSHLTAAQVVKDNVGLQMQTATSPESQLIYAIPNKNPTGNIDTFELRQGPSDVTSYHDFNTLQIAFESVWTELFDSQFAALGQQLYEEYVKLKVFTGTDDGTDIEMSTLDDLTNLMDTIKSFTNTIVDSLPPNLQPADPSQNSGTSLPNDVVDTALGVATGGLSLAIEAALDAIRTAGQKPVLSWNSFPGPLPGHYDTIETSFNKSAKAGTVQIVLKTDPGSHKKYIEFEPWDPYSEHFVQAQPRLIATNDVGSPVLTLNTSQVTSAGVLEFSSEETPSYSLGRYILAGLSDELTDGTQVTFYWKDPQN